MIRRALAGALALALVIPGAALGVTNGGSTPETLVVDVTVSMTAPASASYAKNGAKYDTGNLNISNLTTNNLTGMRVDMTTSAFAGPASKPTTTRSRDQQVQPTGWSTAPNSPRAVGYYATSATADWLASIATPVVAPGNFNIVMHTESADFTAPGTYTGTLSFVAATNP